MRNTACVAACLAVCVAAGQADDKKQGLGSLGLEGLMNIEVTTASKKPEAMLGVAAPIFVITKEDIRRSSATSIPELLRMVPGVQVARVDSNKWAVSIRGFNSRFANKLLVMIDGRSVYTPLFSGVFWDAQNLPVSEIERIEVIRGPGGALWGANAVNGIVNIITASADPEKRLEARVRTGDEDRLLGTLSAGGVSPAGAYRAFASFQDRAGLLDAAGGWSSDDWRASLAGVRLDLSRGSMEQTFTAGAQSSRITQTSLFPTIAPPFTNASQDRFTVSNWYVMGRWTGDGSRLQASLDGVARDMPEIGLNQTVFDLDYQRQANSGALVWGAGYRRSWDRTAATQHISFSPSSRTVDLFSAFMQSELDLKKDLVLTLGLKLEHNPYTGLEHQPSARLRWTRTDSETAWLSVARAVRTPNRAENDVALNFRSGFDPISGLPYMTQLIGSDSFRSESVIASEVGYRFKPSSSTFLDLTAFYNVYDNLRSFEQGAPYFQPLPTPHLVIPIRFDNKLRGSTHGFEAAARWAGIAGWAFSASYSYLHDDLSFETGSTDSLGTLFDSPRNQLRIGVAGSPGRGLDLSGDLKFVDAIRRQGAPAYWRFDLKLGWRQDASRTWTLSLNNLFGPHRKESDSSLFEVPREMGPSFSIQGIWKL